MKIGFDAKRGDYAQGLIEGLSTYYPSSEYVLYTAATSWHRKYPRIIVRESDGALWKPFFLSGRFKGDGLDIYHGLDCGLPFGIEKTAVKRIVTVHDLTFMRYPHLFSAVDRAFYRQKYRYALNKADVVVATCEQTKKDILKYFRTEEDRVRVVYPGCRPRFYHRCSLSKIDSVKERYRLHNKYILYAGAIEESKNIFSLVCAFADIENDDLRLVIAGRGNSYGGKDHSQDSRTWLGQQG